MMRAEQVMDNSVQVQTEDNKPKLLVGPSIGDEPARNDQSHVDESNYNLRSSDVYASSSLRGRGWSSSRYNLVDEDVDVVILENSDIEEEDVEEDESDHNKERCTFEDDDDDGECDDLD
ncbi:hypothetical protein Tco_1018740 [Tanacetum coccineum]|uniref:Uncharacterized protein n=1 Tax=Tanacetum coccineum TaxID=301880 RepID=A0ABQ5FWP3_9ASTR